MNNRKNRIGKKIHIGLTLLQINLETRSELKEIDDINESWTILKETIETGVETYVPKVKPWKKTQMETSSKRWRESNNTT